LGLLFGINNILSLGWGNSRTHLSLKEKNEKNVDDDGSTQKKYKKKSIAKKGLLKKSMFLSNKKTNSSTVLHILFESRKEGWQCINALVGNPRLVN